MSRSVLVPIALLPGLLACSGPSSEPVAPAPATAPSPSAPRPAPPPRESLVYGEDGQLVGGCEVCVYIIENKEQHQPYLCRGLKDPIHQKNCVEVVESLKWWVTNEVYWLNYGCQREQGGAVEWVEACPARVVCSWVEDTYTKQPFCPQDPQYRQPSAADIDARRASVGGG